LKTDEHEMKRFVMNRREFVKSAAVTAGVFGFSGLTAFTPRRAFASIATFDLAAEASPKTLVDGTKLTVWQFRDLNGFGPGQLSAGMVIREGEPVDITLHNDLDRPVDFRIPGVLTDGPSIAPGSSHTYSFKGPPAGTYLFHDAVNGDLGRAMGLAGPMVVTPPEGGNHLFTDGPTFDRQYTLVLHELDDRVNRAVASGGDFDMENYEPNYFFVNGLSYPNTIADDETLIAMNVGERVALRFVNAGLIISPMHFHGYHVEIATRNRQVETAVIDKDTVLVDVDECVDVILPCKQPGAYPLHTHYVPGVTANGVYVNPYGGALLVMNAA
jgi:FtsP/CotA-like multicopper oxidase with cupredoxin domain